MKLHWPFGSDRREEMAAWPLVALSEPRAESWGSREAGALTRDGYLKNAVACRCVRMVAEAAASIPLKTAHEGAARLIRAPKPEASTASFLQALYTEFLLTGNGFVEAVRLPGETAVAAMFPLRTAARRALDLHNAGADWAKVLIDNAAKPSGALIYGGGGRISPDQFDRLKEELAQSFSGAGNAGRPMLLEGRLQWQALSPAEMDFQETRAAAVREIALALGVPPMLLGIPGDNTYSNYREANAAFWRMSVLPLAARVAALSGWLDTPFTEDIEVSFDLDRVPALAAGREALWARIGAADFLNAEEKRVLAGVSQ